MRAIAEPLKPLTELRKPPANIEAEQALLGAILINNNAFEVVSSLIRADHFFEPVHARIFDAISTQIIRGAVANPITLRPFFEHEEPIREPKGNDPGLTVPQYLGRLAAHATSVINARDYAQTIHDLWVRRGLVLVCEDAVNVAYDSPIDLPPAAQVERVEQALFELSREGDGGNYGWTMEAATSSMMDMIAAAYQSDGHIMGLSTGFKDLDSHLGGLVNSDLIIIGGRPSMGKSALAAQIAFAVARNLKKSYEAASASFLGEGAKPRMGEVLFYSLEMSAQQLTMRQTSIDTEIPSTRMREGRFNEREYRRIDEIRKQLAGLPVFIDTTGAISVAQMASRSRRRKRLYDTRLIIVDYLQLMVSGERTENRVAEVSKITAALKAMAKNLDVPVIALCQLSRALESREDKRPQLSDCRESGSIEQDADIILFVYRDEYYLSRSEPSAKQEEKWLAWKAAMAEAEGLAEIIRGKHRHGSVGTTRMQFHAELTRFADLDFKNIKGQNNDH
jgi:replicative DNA helicase